MAEAILGVSLDSAMAQLPLKNSNLSGIDLIWSALFVISSARARPVPNLIEDASMVKLYVLGNLLDCAVQHPDKQQRRNYIGRIMGLKKPFQKSIMASIEQRSASTKHHGRSSSKTPERTPNATTTPSRNTTTQQKTPPTTGTWSPTKVVQQHHPQIYSNGSSVSTPQQPMGVFSQQLQASASSVSSRSSATGSQSPTKLAQQHRAHNYSAAATTPQPMGLLPPPLPTTAPSSATTTAATSKSPAQGSMSEAMLRMNCTGVGASMSSASPVTQSPPSLPQPQPTELSPVKSSLKKGDATNRGYSVAFGSPAASTGFTPDRKRQSHSGGSVSGFLSPGTMESPDRLHMIVMSLQRKNEHMQNALDSYQQKEEEHKQAIEAMETEHRQKMIKVEAESLDRIQEMQREAEERATEFQAQLAEAQEQARQCSSAMNELEVAKEELEVMNHSKAALAETTEKLRKYKDRVAELQDVREALRKEQDAHSQSVDEIIRLENELQQLQSVKRQVDDYRIRAIEAEVKLVECQDYLRRMERHANDQNVKNEYLYKGVVMQKEQMDEMQRRIQEDTQRAMEITGSVNGVGDGISELNPELYEELVRLRNDNLQLRAFQAKRTEDAVQYLEECLDDTKRLADRYKEEYLDTKNTLGATQATLTETQHREANLRAEVKQWQESCKETELRCEALSGQIILCEQQLEQTTLSLEASEQRNSKLRSDVKEWMQKKEEADAVSAERMEKLQDTIRELESTKAILRSAEAALAEIQNDINDLEVAIEEKNQAVKQIEGSLQKTSWDLDDSRKKLADEHCKVDTMKGQVKTLEKQLVAAANKLNEECKQRKEDADEAQRSLEATRQLLETKNKKEQEELQANMTRLLDDERKAYRLKDEETNKKLKQLEQEWNQKYHELQERSTLTLKHSRQEAQERIDFIKKEYEEDLAKLKRDSSENHDNIIRKGRKVLEEAKAKALSELQRIEYECDDLKDKVTRLENEKTELDLLNRGQIAKMKQQLDITTGHANDLVREMDEYLDQIKTLEREKAKLSEENENYRRQIGGRYGADNRVQSQLEKLQKEYGAVVEENRNLKRREHYDSTTGLGLDSIAESVEKGEGDSRPYRRGSGVDRRALTELRNAYEERIASLNDEKRDLIMKMSSQSTDVHKAEKRAWEREEENAKLRSENTSLKLKIERADLTYEVGDGALVLVENRSPVEASFHSTHQGGLSPSPLLHSSPGIDRAKKQKVAQENMLRDRFFSITGIPATPPEKAQPERVQRLVAAYEKSTAIVPTTNHVLLSSSKYQQNSNSDKDLIAETSTGTSSSFGHVLFPSTKHHGHPSSDPLSVGTEMPSVPSRMLPSTPTASKMASDVFRLGSTPEPSRSPPNQRAMTNAMDVPQLNAGLITQQTQVEEPSDESQSSVPKMNSDVISLGTTTEPPQPTANNGTASDVFPPLIASESSQSSAYGCDSKSSVSKMASDVFRLRRASESSRSLANKEANTNAINTPEPRAESIMQQSQFNEHHEDSLPGVTKIACDVSRLGMTTESSGSPLNNGDMQLSTTEIDFDVYPHLVISDSSQSSANGCDNQSSVTEVASDVFRLHEASKSSRILQNERAMTNAMDIPEQYAGSSMQQTQAKEHDDDNYSSDPKMTSDVILPGTTADSSRPPLADKSDRQLSIYDMAMASDVFPLLNFSESSQSSSIGGVMKPTSSMKSSDVFRLAITNESHRSLANQIIQQSSLGLPQQQPTTSIMQYTQLNENGDDSQTDCKQS